VLPLHPFRVKYLDHVLAHMKKHDEVWTTTGGEIAAWYRRLSHDH
jgi:allantoinase